MPVDKKTGELFDTPTASRFTRRQRVARYTVGLRDLTARDVLDVLLDRASAKQTNEFVIDHARRKSIARAISLYRNENLHEDEEPHKPISDRAIKAALTKLVKHKFLERYGRAKYRLNPERFYVGSSVGQIEVLNQRKGKDKPEQNKEAA